MKNRKTVSQKLMKLLIKEIDSKCPLPNCGDKNIEIFHVHHLDNNPQNNSFENLIYLCPSCHSKIPNKGITDDFIKLIKTFLMSNQSKIHTPDSIGSNGETNYVVKNINNNSGNIFSGSQTIEELNINVKKYSTSKYVRSDNDITEEQAFKIKTKVDEIVEINVKAGKIEPSGRGMMYSRILGALKKKYRVTIYKAIPKEKFEEAYTELSKLAAREVSKLRRPQNHEWRKKIYKSIHSRANEKGIEVHDYANKVLNLAKPINSLTELKEQDLDSLRRKLYNLK